MTYDAIHSDSFTPSDQLPEAVPLRSTAVELEATLSLPDALAHEINNPLCAAMLQVAALREDGHDVEALDSALQRIQAVGAELRLPQRLQSVAARRLELNQAFGIVTELLGPYGARVDFDLPAVSVQLDRLSLCHFLHSVLIGHLEGNTRERIKVTGRAKPGRVAIVISSSARSSRVRASLLALVIAGSKARQGRSSHVIAAQLAQSLGFACRVHDSATEVQTLFELPVTVSAQRRRVRERATTSDRRPAV